MMPARTLGLYSLLILGGLSFAEAQTRSWTPPPARELESLIASDPAAAAAAIRKSWGAKSLQTGRNRWIEQTTMLWALIHPEPVSVFRSDTNQKIGDLHGLDDQGLQALALSLPNCSWFDYELRTRSGTRVSQGNLKLEYYPYPADSSRKEGVPQGKVTRHSWTDSKLFPGTSRDYEVYVPAQYDGTEAASLMVFQDGLRHADPNSQGGLRATTVFDNLIASGAMPVTVGLFINPGRKQGQDPKAKPANRSFEYDSLGDLYVRFLTEEIIPQVVSEHGLKLSEDPKRRAIAGGSSGCACAWTAAWERPDQFGKVLGWVGTFVDIRGANAYPSLIRKTERKPIRAALLGETRDLDNQFGNWPLANRQMEAALQFMEYDHRYWWGEGFHGSRHAAVMLPEMLTWLWSDVSRNP